MATITTFLESFDKDQMIQVNWAWIIHTQNLYSIAEKTNLPLLHLFPKDWWIAGRITQDEYKNILFWIVSVYQGEDFRPVEQSAVRERVQHITKDTLMMSGFCPTVCPKYCILRIATKEKTTNSWASLCDAELDDGFLTQTVPTEKIKSISKHSPGSAVPQKGSEFYAQKTASVDVYNIYDAQKQLLGIASIPTLAISHAMYARFERISLSELLPVSITVRESNGRTKWIPNL